MIVKSLPMNYGDRVAIRCERLRVAYDRKYRLRTQEQYAQAKLLLAAIGSVDWKSEGYASPENQRDLSIKFHWGHNHKFTDELIVEGRMKDRHLSVMAEFIEGFDLSDAHFRGKEALDVGCWTGGTTLTLKLLGAGRILALEEVQKYADASNALFSTIYGFDDLKCAPISLYNLKDGAYDSIYFPGVIYHLSDPVLALRRLFNRLRDGGDILIESQGIKHDEPMCRFDGNRKYTQGGEEGEFNRGGWNWFSPSPACLALWMEEAGFEGVEVYYSPVSSRVFGYGKRVTFREITRAGLSVVDIE